MNLLVKVIDGVGLLSNDVVEAVCRVGVDQAVADPFRRLYAVKSESERDKMRGQGYTPTFR